MEVGLESRIPTYSGGLGVLAGDTLRAAADLGVPMVGVTLLHRRGNFRQRLDAGGWQTEEPVDWDVPAYMEELPQRVSVSIEGRTVYVRAWRYRITGVRGHTVPVLLLDTDLPENSEFDRTLTHYLYGGDSFYRLCQEVVLGIGGVRMLRALGYNGDTRFHMNEGHAALLTLELLNEHATQAGWSTPNQDDVRRVKRQCVFTTHTPVPAGHDQFPIDLVRRALGDLRPLAEVAGLLRTEDPLNMTHLALNLSGYINAVAQRHGEVSRAMFPGHAIDAITNGVHSATWASPPFQQLFDRYLPEWRRDSLSLRRALAIPPEEIRQAHLENKRRLVRQVRELTGAELDEGRLTLGFARRAAAYKRADLLFTDLDRLRAAAARGAFQVIFAGKAHPQDLGGKEVIQRVFQMKEALRGSIEVVYLENYEMDLGEALTSGADVWLNTPEPPLEASGTSGMKAALNGVPSLSVLDGWWVEGHIEGVTGWSVGEGAHAIGEAPDRAADADSLYRKLTDVVIPLFYGNQDGFVGMMRQCIAVNGAYFSTHRMVMEYVLKAYSR